MQRVPDPVRDPARSLLPRAPETRRRGAASRGEGAFASAANGALRTVTCERSMTHASCEQTRCFSRSSQLLAFQGDHRPHTQQLAAGAPLPRTGPRSGGPARPPRPAQLSALASGPPAPVRAGGAGPVGVPAPAPPQSAGTGAGPPAGTAVTLSGLQPERSAGPAAGTALQAAFPSPAARQPGSPRGSPREQASSAVPHACGDRNPITRWPGSVFGPGAAGGSTARLPQSSGGCLPAPRSDPGRRAGRDPRGERGSGQGPGHRDVF